MKMYNMACVEICSSGTASFLTYLQSDVEDSVLMGAEDVHCDPCDPVSQSVEQQSVEQLSVQSGLSGHIHGIRGWVGNGRSLSLPASASLMGTCLAAPSPPFSLFPNFLFAFSCMDDLDQQSSHGSCP